AQPRRAGGAGGGRGDAAIPPAGPRDDGRADRGTSGRGRGAQPGLCRNPVRTRGRGAGCPGRPAGRAGRAAGAPAEAAAVTTPVIELRDVTKTYWNGDLAVQVLHGI